MKTMQMDSARWLLSRIAAAVVGAILVGVLADLIASVIQVLTCGPACVSAFGKGTGPAHCTAYASTCRGLWEPLFFNLPWTVIGAVILGTLPGIVALTQSPAKDRPWRALPALILATIVGVALCLCLASALGRAGVGAVALFVIPSATGLLAAWNIRRLPRPFRIA